MHMEMLRTGDGENEGPLNTMAGHSRATAEEVKENSEWLGKTFPLEIHVDACIILLARRMCRICCCLTKDKMSDPEKKDVLNY